MATPKISEVLAQSGVAFGTSGARGLVEQFTDEYAVQLPHDCGLIVPGGIM